MSIGTLDRKMALKMFCFFSAGKNITYGYNFSLIESSSKPYMEMLSFNNYCLVIPVRSSTKAIAMLINETQSRIKKDGFSVKVVIVLL